MHEKAINLGRSLELLSMEDMLAILAKLESNVASMVLEFFDRHLRYVTFPENISLAGIGENGDRRLILEPAGHQLGGKPAQVTCAEEISKPSTPGSEERLNKKYTRAKLELIRKAKPILEEWLDHNLLDPYPSNEEKKMLSKRTGLTYMQITNWFINKRVRISKKKRQLRPSSK